MELLEQQPTAPLHRSPAVKEIDERAARRSLRGQVARLERALAEAFVTAYRMGGLERGPDIGGEPRLLNLGEIVADDR